MLIRILSLFKFLTPGDAVKDSALAIYGYLPAVFMHMETGLLLGILNLLLVALFRGLELRHRMKIERLKAERRRLPDEADS